MNYQTTNKEHFSNVSLNRSKYPLHVRLFFSSNNYVIDMAFPAATVATIFLLAKIWDAVNDSLFGIIIDKVYLKKGKFIPWTCLSSFLIPIPTVITFVLPNTAPLGLYLLSAFHFAERSEVQPG
jgi:Na+/melibiose symporter-like transporter